MHPGGHQHGRQKETETSVINLSLNFASETRIISLDLELRQVEIYTSSSSSGTFQLAKT